MSLPSSPLQTNYFSGAWLEYTVLGLDRWLRQRQGVYEYTNEPRCLFRVQRSTAETNFSLSDGTHIAAGDPILNLHLWNEHIPHVRRASTSMAWARQLSQSIQNSLQELARYLAEQPDLQNVVAVRADMRLGPAEQTKQIIRLSSRYGFEEVSMDIPLNTLHRFGENIYLLFLALATNPTSAEMSILRRDRALVYMSRTTLERRHGHVSKQAPHTRDLQQC